MIAIYKEMFRTGKHLLIVLVVMSTCLDCYSAHALQWGKALKGHNFRSFFGITMRTCFKECRSRVQCRSLNYRLRGHWCALNKDNNVIDVEVKPGYFYSDRHHKKLSDLPDHCENCSEIEKCNFKDELNPCSVQECERVEPIGAGIVLGTSTRVGSKVKHECREYEYDQPANEITCDNYRHGNLISSAISTCLSNGSWSVVNFTCPFANCSVLAPYNGIATPADTARHKQEVTYQCKTGYTLSGDSNQNCFHGYLSGYAPTCFKDCEVPLLENGQIYPPGTLKHGQMCELMCNHGYTLFSYAASWTICFDGTIDLGLNQCMPEYQIRMKDSELYWRLNQTSGRVQAQPATLDDHYSHFLFFKQDIGENMTYTIRSRVAPEECIAVLVTNEETNLLSSASAACAFFHFYLLEYGNGLYITIEDTHSEEISFVTSYEGSIHISGFSAIAFQVLNNGDVVTL